MHAALCLDRDGTPPPAAPTGTVAVKWPWGVGERAMSGSRCGALCGADAVWVGRRSMAVSWAAPIAYTAPERSHGSLAVAPATVRASTVRLCHEAQGTPAWCAGPLLPRMPRVPTTDPPVPVAAARGYPIPPTAHAPSPTVQRPRRQAASALPCTTCLAPHGMPPGTAQPCPRGAFDARSARRRRARPWPLQPHSTRRLPLPHRVGRSQLQ